MAQSSMKALGRKVTEYEGLDTFPKGVNIESITLFSDEVTSVCPVTGQADWYTVSVTYRPNKLCIESKTFKLLMGSYRNRGIFCENLSSIILQEVIKAISPLSCEVTVIQKPRGGVSITAVARKKGKQ